MSDSSEDDHKSNLVKSLRTWAATENVSKTAINKLLQILNSYFPYLPLDSRTLLKSPTISGPCEILNTGKFSYLGIQYALQKCIPLVPEAMGDQPLRLYFNIDGIPLCKSNNLSFQPILVHIQGQSGSPAVIALHCGTKKPDVKDFFGEFKQELTEIISNGFQFKNKRYTVSIGMNNFFMKIDKLPQQ